MAPLRKVQPGDRLRIPASAYNDFVDAANAVKNGQFAGGRGQGVVDTGRQFILVRNDSGEDLARFSILGIDAPVILPATNLDEFKNRVVLSGVTPTTDHAGRFTVLQEPLADGAIGRACIIGVCPVQVNVTDEGHTFAEAEEGYTGRLASAAAGSALILWKEDGTGQEWAVVRIGTGNGGSSGGIWTPSAFWKMYENEVVADTWYDCSFMFDPYQYQEGYIKCRYAGTLRGLSVTCHPGSGAQSIGNIFFSVAKSTGPLTGAPVTDAAVGAGDYASAVNSVEGTAVVAQGDLLKLIWKTDELVGDPPHYLSDTAAWACFDIVPGTPVAPDVVVVDGGNY